MKKLFKIIFKIFDKLEDVVRGKLTHYPITYSIIGSIAIVSIWRGIWVISDDLKLTGWESLIGGTLLALVTGLMVSFFIGENIIISGLNRGKKIEEKTEAEVRYEENILFEIQKDIKDLKESLKEKI